MAVIVRAGRGGFERQHAIQHDQSGARRAREQTQTRRTTVSSTSTARWLGNSRFFVPEVLSMLFERLLSPPTRTTGSPCDGLATRLSSTTDEDTGAGTALGQVQRRLARPHRHSM